MLNRLVLFSIVTSVISFASPAVFAEPVEKAIDWTPAEAENSLDYHEAKQLMTKQKWADAAIVLRSLHRKSPRSAEISIDLATSLTQSQRREEALAALSQSAGLNKGAVQEKLARKTRVISKLFLTSQTQQTYLDGLNLLIAQKYGPALESLNRALEQEPDNVEILTRIGQALVLDRDYDSAAERLRLAKKLNPFEPEVSLWLGEALHQRGELQESINELRFAQRGNPRSEHAPVWLSATLASTGQRPLAIEVLEEDLKLQPFHVKSLLELAKLRATAPSRDKNALYAAKKDLQVAMSRIPKYAAGEAPPFEGDLGVNSKRNAEELNTEATRLLAMIEGKIEELSHR